MEGGPPTFRQGFSGPALLMDAKRSLPVRGCHPLWPAFPDGSGSSLGATGLVRVRSPLLAESRLMSFPPATEMFQFAGFASPGYQFTWRYRRSGGLPHSEIPGSKLAHNSPGLFAACHVLHRLYMPRHPPNALLSLESLSARHAQGIKRYQGAGIRNQGSGIKDQGSRSSPEPGPGPFQHSCLAHNMRQSRPARNAATATDHARLVQKNPLHNVQEPRPEAPKTPRQNPSIHNLCAMPRHL